VVAAAASLVSTTPALAAPGDLTLASTSSAGVKGDRDSRNPSLTPDGTKVAFVSGATNLDASDMDLIPDIYVKDLVTGLIALASTSTGGVEKNNGGSGHPSLSADGTRVAFDSAADNLVPEDTNFAPDIFVKDLVTNETTLVSVSQAGVRGNLSSTAPAVSADGTKVAFESGSTTWGTDQLADIYVKDLLSGELTLVSISDLGVSGNSDSFHPAISADGTKVAFESTASNWDPADGDGDLDIYVKDLTTGELTLASTSTTGTSGNDDSYFVAGPAYNEAAYPDPLSADGTTVAFSSNATDLDPDDTDPSLDIFVKDLASGVLTLASTSDAGDQANGASELPSLSSDGTKVTFSSQASNLDCLDIDRRSDVYVKDLLTGDITLLSITASGQKGNDTSSDSAISSDGSRVAFISAADNLDPSDTDGFFDIYVKEPTATSCPPPDAVDDTLTTQEDTPGTVIVLANDTDPDGDALTVTGNTQGTNGSVTCSADGECTYTPNAGFNGVDSFTYDISDGEGGIDTATVNVTVTPVNDPPDAVDDALTTQENSPGTVNVHANDTDPDGDTLTVTGSTDGVNGSVTCSAAGDCTYSPNAGFSGSDAFTYTTSDGNGGSDTATVNVTVRREADVTEIDIKVSPWRNISLTNTKSLKVVILSTPGFDATTLDFETICFGDAEEPSERSCEPLRPASVDVDRDGDLDLVVHFKTDRTGIDVGDTEVCLHGMTLDGTPIEGCTDVQRVVP
jgi:Bacterial Ig domain/WD40-like Beta Propeller Repeat